MDRKAAKVDERYLKHIAVSFLWDMPLFVENPTEIVKLIERFKSGKTLPYDMEIIETLRERLSLGREGRKIYKELFGENPPEKVKWFTPPDELVRELQKKFNSKNL